MAALVNGYRAELGLRPLSIDTTLLDKARAHSLNMLARGAPAHSGNLRAWAQAKLPDWQLVGENVGMLPLATPIYDSLLKMHRAFIGSPRHNRNLVADRFNLMAIGVVRDEHDGIWITQLFAQASPTPVAVPVPRAPVPPKVEAPPAAQVQPAPKQQQQPPPPQPVVHGTTVAAAAPVEEQAGRGAMGTVLIVAGVIALGLVLSRFAADI